MIKLIVSDVDGTLIRRYREGIPEELFSLVDRLFEKGVYFAVATGRQYENARLIFEPVKDKIFFLCENGCKTVFRGECIDLSPLETGHERELMEDILNAPGCELWLNAERNGHLIEGNPLYIEEMEKEVVAFFQVDPDLDSVDDRLTKIGLLQWHEEHVRPEIEGFFKEKYGDFYQVVTSGHGWLDFIAKDAGKGAALKRIMDRLKLLPEETVVFGDNENDLSMFRCTPNSYAMDTSYEHVKKQAAHVTSDVVSEIRRLTEGMI